MAKKKTANRKTINQTAKAIERKAGELLFGKTLRRYGSTGLSNVDVDGQLMRCLPQDIKFEIVEKAAPALIRNAMAQAIKAGGCQHDSRMVFVHIVGRQYNTALVCCHGDNGLKNAKKVGGNIGLEVKSTRKPSKIVANIDSPIYFKNSDLYVFPLKRMEYK